MTLKQPQKNKREGWFGITNDFVDSELKILKPFSFSVYACLLSHADFHDHTCYPSQKTIAEKTGMSQKSVVRCIAELKRRGYITIQKRKVREHLINVYKLYRGIPEYSRPKSIVKDRPPPSVNKYENMVSESHTNKTEYNKNHLSRHTVREENEDQKKIKEGIKELVNKMRLPP